LQRLHHGGEISGSYRNDESRSGDDGMSEENEDLEQLIEECREHEREAWEKMTPEMREYLRRQYGTGYAAVREYPTEAVAGISPELAWILDLTEEEILKYAAE